MQWILLGFGCGLVVAVVVDQVDVLPQNSLSSYR